MHGNGSTNMLYATGMFVARQTASKSVGMRKGLLLMALMTLDRPLVVEIVARNADLMGNFFTPSFNLPFIRLVAVKTFIVKLLLMFSVLQREHHYPHLDVDDFRAEIFGRVGQNRR